MSKKTNYLLVVIFMLIAVSAFADDFPDRCFEFDGIDDYILAENISSTFNAVTIEAWIYHNSLPTGDTQRYITLGEELAVIRYDGAAGNRQLHFYIRKADGNLVSIRINDLLTTEEWTHVAGTYDGTTMKLYVNGLEVGNSSPGGDLYTFDGNCIISRSPETFDGKMDNVRIWNIVRTQAEIYDTMHQYYTTGDGRVANWRMDETSGTTASDDWNNNNATLYNMPYYMSTESTVPYFSDEAGFALDFDGVDDYLDAGTSGWNLGNNLTIEGWINPSSLSARSNIFSTRSENSDGAFQLEVGPGNGGLNRVVVTGRNTWVAQTADNVINENEWTHIAYTRSGTGTGNHKIYVNGVEQTITVSAYDFTDNIDIKTIGAAFTGEMDELRIWNDARTTTEINDNMHGFFNGDEANLVSYFQFNTGFGLQSTVPKGIIAYDVVSGNNGRMMNMTEDDWITSYALVGQSISVSGTISSDAVWDSDIVFVTGDVTVNNDVTLTINSGVIVHFDGSYSLNIDGTLIAVGIPDSIKFTGNSNAPWQGIVFDETAETNDQSMLEHCILENTDVRESASLYNGGAIYIKYFSNLLIKNCRFENNKALHGGAIFCYGSSPEISQCVFKNNYAFYKGGGIVLGRSGSPELNRCIFTGNYAEDYGGGIYIYDVSNSGTCTPIITNSLIKSNQTINYTGGGVYISQCATTITNCTIIENDANEGGGISITTDPNSTIMNCIIYGNTATSGDQIHLLNTNVDPDFYHCNIEGGLGGFSGAGSGVYFSGDYEHCMDYDPGFTDAANGDYSLTSLSHCINGGDPVTDVGSWDLAGHSRQFLGSGCNDNIALRDALRRVDIGAYEYQGSSGIVPDGFTVSGNVLLDATDFKLVILNGFTMSIDAGSVWEFVDGTGINIYGNLQAIGEAGNMIYFQPVNIGEDFIGLNFISSSIELPTSSVMEYCVIKEGKGESSRSEDYGGNIYLYKYDELTMENCIVSGGLATYGGGLYAREMDNLNLKNCMFTGNECSAIGGAIYVNNSQTSMINVTIVDNIAGTDRGAFRFVNCTTKQPEIKNCIVWNNGDDPIELAGGSFTDLSYCNLDFSYTGTGNISVDPVFIGSVDHPYNIRNDSYCINMGIPDTSGLNLPANDLLGNPRIFAHTTSSYDRVDIGAYEHQGLLGPDNFTASGGDSAYPGYVQLSWSYNPDYEPTPENFRIFRNNISINFIDGQTLSYSDYTAVPGEVYTYYVQASADGQTGDSQEDSGFIKPNGIISGTVLTANNNPVQGVKVTLDPSTGYCLEFDSSNPSELTVENPEVNMDFNFTIEFWFKTFMSDVILLNKGTHNFKINSASRVEYTDGTNTLTQDSLSVDDNEWHHIAVVNDYTNSRTILYLDEYEVASNETFIFSGSSDDGFATSTSFTGFLDELKIWSVARDSLDIVEGMDVSTAIDEEGLMGYWTLNEGNGNFIFDATDFNHNGTLSDCDWSANDPGILLGAFTDVWGEYIIRQINYGASTTFAVTPYKSGHIFQPELRNVTLSVSNIAQNGIDFIDNSMIPISGQVSYQNTNCPVVGATILLNGVAVTPLTLTDEDGYYVMEVEHGTECILSVDSSGHIMNREWHLGEVTFPQSGKDFEDTFTTSFKLEVVGGDDHYPIGDFDVLVQSVNGCYADTIFAGNGDWDDGEIMVNTLPPLDFNITVDPAGSDPFNLAIDEQFQNMKTDLISLTYTDSTLDTLRFVWKAPLQITVSWPDTLLLHSFAEYPESEFYVLPQNEWMEVEIQAMEDYSWETRVEQITYLDNCDILIIDDVGTSGEIETNFDGDSLFVYRFAPYLPNILSGFSRQYQNMMEITVRDLDLNRFSTQTDWILTTGVKPLESTYATTSPEIPFLVLHDPPGDGSSAAFSQSSSHSIGFETSVCTDSEHNVFMNIHLGPDITISAGSPFFSVEHEIDFTADFDLGLTLGTSQTQSMEQELTFTTSQEYTTSEEDQVIGAGADVFVGGALNLIWGITKEISWDFDLEEVIIDTSVMVSPDGFATVYVYTDNQIRNTVIPNLLVIGDSTSAALWQEFLDTNEDNIANAVANPNHPDNISFNSGAGYSYEEESTVSQSQTIEFESSVSVEFGALIGLTVDGVGAEFGYTFNTSVTMGTSSNSGFETTTTSSFTLADDDETSDLNDLADYFTIDIKTDPVYGTPVFDLISGGTSCPWEENTIPREGVNLSANTYTASGLLEGEEAAFLLQLGNTSQTNEDRRYYLTVLHGTNPGGATVKINGVPLETEMAFDVLAGQTVQAVMTVEQGPFAFEYEDLTLEFYSAEDRGNDGPDGHFFDVFREFNIYWEAPYSRISINSPADNWIINQANDDTMMVMLTDYDLSKPDFASIKLQYKHPADENWLPAFEIFRDSLASSHPNYIEVPWDVSGISDGLYEIRAATTDSVQADYYTDALSGVIDRTPPEVLDLPEPADEILELGDVISLSFVEFIDPVNIATANFSLTITRTGNPVSFDVDIFENRVSLIPNIANFWFENETIEAEVSDLKDLYGNTMEEPVTWEFYVNSNPVEWNVTKLDVIKSLGEPMTLTANLENGGGQYYSYVFTDYADSLYHSDLEYHAPDWLSITPTSGQLIPLDTQVISFEISDQIGFGHYETIIYAHTPMGNEAIEIEVDVLSNPPDWSITQFNNFQSSMSIIGELNIEGDLSVDTNDIIGAFMQEESGDWVCRGVANIEAVPYITSHPYQVFLTIYSDEEDPVRTEDEIIFRLWDNSDNKEYYQIDHSVFGGTLMYLANEVLGTPMNPVSLATVGDMVQDIPLVSGWTWFSTNLDLIPNTINNVLGSLSPIEDDFIKDQSQYAQYFTDQWVGSLTTMNNTSMYKINLANEQILEIIGELKDPVLTTITYNSGWNWIGYVPHVSMSVNQAMEDRNNVTGDFIKNQCGYAFYVDSDTGWIGSLRFMNPGEGFMLYANVSGSFEYPEYGSRAFDNFPIYEPIVFRDAPDWSVNPQSFEYTASLTAELQISGNPAVSGNYLIGAFVGEECRGSVTPINVGNTWLYFLTVFSNTQNEEISLKVYDADANEIIDPANSFIFTNDLILGTPSIPYELEIDGTLGIPQNIGIEISGGNVVISWDLVSGASSYKVFASDSPEGVFANVSNSGTFDGSRWIAPLTESRKFYYVVASTEVVVRGSIPTQSVGTRK